MKKAIRLAVALGALCATQAMAQGEFSYDPLFVLPGAAQTMGVDGGISSTDLSSIGDVSDVFTMGKYSISEKLEVGARATFGFLQKDGDAFSRALIGAKYGLSEKTAATANLLLPVGEVNDPGVSVGFMQSMEAGTLNVDGALQVGLLKGFAAKGASIDLLIEPSKVLNEKLTGYVDITVTTNTDDIGNSLNIDVLPYLDYTLQEGMVLSGGISLNAYSGDTRSSDVGVRAIIVKTIGK